MLSKIEFSDYDTEKYSGAVGSRREGVFGLSSTSEFSVAPVCQTVVAHWAAEQGCG